MVISCPPSMKLLTELCVCFSSVVSLPAGSFKIISRNGRLEKSVDAHRGACISLRWSYDGEGVKGEGTTPANLCPPLMPFSSVRQSIQSLPTPWGYVRSQTARG